MLFQHSLNHQQLIDSWCNQFVDGQYPVFLLPSEQDSSVRQKSENSGGSALFLNNNKKKKDKNLRFLSMIWEQWGFLWLVRPTEPPFWDSEPYFLGCGGHCWK